MNIAIVFGGKSVEHDVSIVTAKQIYNLCKNNYNVLLIYVNKNNELLNYTNLNFDFKDFKTTNNYFKQMYLQNGYANIKTTFAINKKVKIDCAIMCTHGGNGENGTLASHFISCKIPVTAGNSTALGISMNKWLSKQFFKAEKINYVKGFYADTNSSLTTIDNQIKQSFDYPVIIKPNGGGSSIGIKIANNFEELKECLKVAFEFDYSVVVEKALTNFTEYNCAVFGDSENFEISKIDQPLKNDQILSFKDKYLNGDKSKKGSMKTQKREYPVLDQSLKQKIEEYSAKIFKNLGFYGVVRIDYMYQPKLKKLYVNEINAIPGSLANYFFIDNKLRANMFIDKLISIGIKNYNKMFNLNQNYITNLF